MAPMLVIAGVRDTQVPISDIYLLLSRGDAPKTAWNNPQGGHLGRQVKVWPDPLIFKEVIGEDPAGRWQRLMVAPSMSSPSAAGATGASSAPGYGHRQLILLRHFARSDDGVLARPPRRWLRGYSCVVPEGSCGLPRRRESG